MPIPDYQTIMLPLLKIACDGKVHSTHSAIEELSDLFNLSNEERKELLPSGKQTKFANRVGWAKTYLVKSKILKYPKRAHFQVTERGVSVLEENLEKINNLYLSRFEEFVDFRRRGRNKPADNDKQEDLSDLTPEEAFDSAYLSIRTQLADNLLELVLNSTPSFFEKLVVDLLVSMGYGGTQQNAARSVGRVGDEGIDGIIDEDRLGLDSIYIQAKRWQPENTVGRPEIQKFVGALQGKRARKGVFITTSSFSSDAVEYADNIDSKVVLINGERLTSLMIDFEIGVTTNKTYDIKKIDMDFFEEIYRG